MRPFVVMGYILLSEVRMRRRRINKEPPSANDINRILSSGARPKDNTQYPDLLRCLRQSCYLNATDQTLESRERLLTQYKKDGLVLFLGAGVSVGSGIPNWQKLARDLIVPEVSSDYKEVKRAFPSLPTQFQLAACKLPPGQFVKKLYERLYSGLKFKKGMLKDIPRKREEQRNWSGWDKIRKELGINRTLKCVGDLLIVENESTAKAEFRRNPQIHAVLTLNVDNLLELYCQSKTSGRKLLTMVDRASVGDHPDLIPVYHLHGTLDARDENFLAKDRPPTGVSASELQKMVELIPDLVFRESEYYETIANPVSFVNHTPQSYLQRLNVLFIGTSIDDVNIRRWLYASFRERVQHRIKYLRELYRRKYKDAEVEAELESVRHFWLRTNKERGKKLPKKDVELVMKKLGVQVVWCDDLNDLRSCVRDLKEKGKESAFGKGSAPCPE